MIKEVRSVRVLPKDRADNRLELRKMSEQAKVLVDILVRAGEVQNAEHILEAESIVLLIFEPFCEIGSVGTLMRARKHESEPLVIRGVKELARVLETKRHAVEILKIGEKAVFKGAQRAVKRNLTRSSKD